MKKVIFFGLYIFVMSSLALGYNNVREIYYCTVGDALSSGISSKNSVRVLSDNTIEGVVAGKKFSFQCKPRYSSKTNVATWADKDTRAKVEIQIPGPYEGVQDVQWGRLTLGANSKEVSCYPTGN